MSELASRGRRKQIDDKEFIDTIMKFKDSVVKNGSITSKSDGIWEKIRGELNCAYKASSLYSMVLNDRASIRNKLLPSRKRGATSDSSDESVSPDDADEINNSVESVESEEEEINFSFIISQEDLQNLVERRTYQISKRTRKKQEWLIFKPESYKEYFRKKVFEHTGLKCGYHVRRSYMNVHGDHGYVKGHCNCGSTLSLKIITHGQGPDYSVHGSIDVRKGKCGKPFLRDPIRSAIAENLQTMSADAFRASLSKELIKRPGDPEPPMIPKSGVLHRAKSDYKAGKFLHKDPLKALKFMKDNKYSEDIHFIGLSPAAVQYSTPLQNNFCKKIAKAEPIHLAIDSGGGLVEDIDGKKIFCHIASVKYSGGEFVATTMFSEKGDGQTINEWLSRWRQMGAPLPLTMTMDWARALLNGATLACTPFKYIDQYVEWLAKVDDPGKTPFIRIDGAHTMAKYKKKTQKYRKPLKIFLRACIGRLIMSDSLEDAEKIVKNLLIILHSETEGVSRTGDNNACEEAKLFLNNEVAGMLIDQESGEPETTDGYCADGENDDNANDDSDDGSSTSSLDWSTNVLDKARALIEEKGEGNRVNAFYLPDFAQYLMKDLPLLGIFSNIYASKFKINPKKAPTSGHVEFGFKHLKTTVFSKVELPMRLDGFVPRHIDYLYGRLKLDAADDQITTRTESGEEGLLCSACRNESATSRLYQCIRCRVHVHDQEPCSLVDQGQEDEESRVCVPCSRKSTNAEMLPAVDEGDSIAESIIPPQDISRNQKRQPDQTRNQTRRTQCFACENFGKANGSHECIVCKDKVHPFDECSFPVGAEGYAQDRLCFSCYDKGYDIHGALTSRELEEPESHSDRTTSSNGVNTGKTREFPQNCPDCHSNGKQSGTHECIVCAKPIHASTLCSTTVGETGPLQSRICLDCNSNAKGDAEEIAARNDDERIVTERRGKTAMYYGENRSKIRDALAIERHARIPILKNGKLKEMSLVRFNKMAIRFELTCSFDAFFQILLTATYDFPIVAKCVGSGTNVEKNNIFALIAQTLKSGVGSHSYLARGKMLLKYFPEKLEIVPNMPGIHYFDATTNVGTMAGKMLGQYSSYNESHRCVHCGIAYGNPLTLFPVDPSVLTNKDLSNILKDRVIQLGGKICKSCSRLEEVTCSTGPIVVLDVARFEDDELIKIKLKDIPQNFGNPDPSKQALRLSGVVEYEELSRDKNGKITAHYKAYSYRRGDGAWCLMDDFAPTVERVTGNTAIVIALILLCEE
ncbi:hypothetical protein QAD02_005099 [Eretmocerus hayati]|uniref:Uncharacterized protein n=1 Tax=Eretmocerus hayati TaxID=131215 RepID=A0ACC2NRW2_9HYME|nr:hypothetical protein QAD02_005099 [Eretmocerus hayati]